MPDRFNMEVHSGLPSLFLQLFNDQLFLLQEHLGLVQLIFNFFKLQLQVIRLFVKFGDLALELLVHLLLFLQRFFEVLNDDTKLSQFNRVSVDLSLDLHFFGLILNMLVVQRDQRLHREDKFHEHCLFFIQNFFEKSMLGLELSFSFINISVGGKL